MLLVRPRALAEECEDIIGRLQQACHLLVLDHPHEIAAIETDEWDVVAGPGSMPCDARFLDRLPRIRALVAAGSGIEGMDRAAASARGILIGDGAVEENSRDMAEATLMLMLALLRDLDGARESLRAGRRMARPVTRALGSQTVGLIGFGRVARALVALLTPFGCRILVSTPRRDLAQVPPRVEMTSLEHLLSSSDIVSIHSVLNAQTRGLLDAQALALMKPSACLVNTARGGIADEAAVAEALNAGLLRGAAFDCFAHEAPEWSTPLRDAHNVILTPHCIGHSADGARAMAAMFEENILRSLRGEPPCRLRNPEALSTSMRRSTTS